MAENRIEYRFVLDGYTPETLPQKLLAELMADLADLYGEVGCVHFVRVEPTNSTALVSSVEVEASEVVEERIQTVTDVDGPADAKKAVESIRRRVESIGHSAYLADPNGHRVLEFPAARPLAEKALVYGPFWQRSRLTGTVILLGGKSDPVSVKIQVKEKTITCKATRDVARSLRDYIWGAPVRVDGNGQWTRDHEGVWKLLRFDISTFDPIDDEPLTTTVARLRGIEGKWKNRPDPLAELEAIRNGDDGDS